MRLYHSIESCMYVLYTFEELNVLKVSFSFCHSSAKEPALVPHHLPDKTQTPSLGEFFMRYFMHTTLYTNSFA